MFAHPSTVTICHVSSADFTYFYLSGYSQARLRGGSSAQKRYKPPLAEDPRTLLKYFCKFCTYECTGRWTRAEGECLRRQQNLQLDSLGVVSKTSGIKNGPVAWLCLPMTLTSPQGSNSSSTFVIDTHNYGHELRASVHHHRCLNYVSAARSQSPL